MPGFNVGKDKKNHSLRKESVPLQAGRRGWKHRCTCGHEYGVTTEVEAREKHRAHKRERGVWGA